MKTFLTLLPWILLILSVVISVLLAKNILYQKKKVKAEQLKTLKAEKKSDLMKLNIDRLTRYNSSDMKIRSEAENNIKGFINADTENKVKSKLEELHFNLNNIYYGK